MAISKERLEELIEQGATIWSEDWNEEVELSKKNCEIHDVYDERNRPFMTRLFVREDDLHCPSYNIRCLTEDVDAGLWQLEFGDIKKEERLALPTWQKFNTHNFISDGEFIGFWNGIRRYKLHILNGTRIIIFDYGRNISIFNEALTKDGYLSACRLAKKLFLGEE